MVINQFSDTDIYESNLYLLSWSPGVELAGAQFWAYND